MERRDLTDLLPAGWTETDAGRIHEWVAAQGINVQGVEIAATKDGELRRLVVTSDDDPTPLLASYVATPTARQRKEARAIQFLKNRIATIRAKPQNTWTVEEETLYSLYVLIRAQDDA